MKDCEQSRSVDCSVAHRDALFLREALEDLNQALIRQTRGSSGLFLIPVPFAPLSIVAAFLIVDALGHGLFS